MRGRYKIAILVSASLVAWIGLTGPGICIFVAGPQPNWLGSDGVCGPMVTYELQKYFGILWYDAGMEDPVHPEPPEHDPEACLEEC